MGSDWSPVLCGLSAVAVALFGVPSVFSLLCVHLVKGLLAQVFGSCEPTRVASAGEFQSHSSQNSLFFHDIPEPGLIEHLVRENVSLIAFLSSAETNIHEFLELWASPAVNAFRQTSLSMSALEEVITVPDVFIIRSHGSRKIDVQELLRKLVLFLGFSSHRVNIAQIMQDLSLQAARDGNVYLEDQLQPAMILAGCAPGKKTETECTRKLISSLKDYNSILELNPMSTVCWPGEIFLTEGNKPAGVGQTVNLMGPARVLVYGPYLGLPRGKWTATIKFSVFNNTSRNRVILDISQNYSEDVLAKGETNLPASGTYSCEMFFQVTNPHLPIEARLLTTQGAIEGELEFLGVDLRRH